MTLGEFAITSVTSGASPIPLLVFGISKLATSLDFPVGFPADTGRWGMLVLLGLGPIVGDADLAVDLLADAMVAFIYSSVTARGFSAVDAFVGRYGGLPRSSCLSLIRPLNCASSGCPLWLADARVD